jgi:hypothetical protein
VSITPTQKPPLVPYGFLSSQLYPHHPTVLPSQLTARAVTRLGSGGVGEKTKLIAGAYLTERQEGGGQLERHEPKGKTYFRKYATDARASWAGKDGFSPREERGQLGQRLSGPVRLAGPKAKKKNF